MTQLSVAEPFVEPAVANGFPLSLARALGASVLSGMFYFLAFPGMDLWPLGFIALVPLRLALVGQSSKRAFWLGWLSGFTMISLGFYWMVAMLQKFSGFPIAVCLFFVLVVNAFMAGRSGLFAWLFVRSEQRGWAPGWCWLCALASSELLYPVLFKWSFGAVVHQVPALTQVAELGGVMGVALTVAAGNWGLAELLRRLLERRKLAPLAWAPWVAVPVIAALYGAIRIPQEDARAAAAPHSTIGLVQANMSLMGKRHDVREGMRRHLNGTAKLVETAHPALVLWSETSVARPISVADAVNSAPVPFAAQLSVPLLFGTVLYERVSDAREYALFNSVLITDAAGAVRGRYDKQELVPFSEHMPFGRELPVLYDISPNSGKFDAGTSVEPLPLAGHKVAVMVCNDDVTTVLANKLTRDTNTDLLANLTNDAWFGDTTEPWIHLALAKFRAIEHRRYFVRSTNSGVSAFIDPVGRVVAHSDTFHEQTLAVPVAWLRGRTLFEWLQNYPFLVGAALVIGAAFFNRPKRAKPARRASGVGA